ncbi:MAG TPA: hypothetical protein VNL16_15385 [Chloroflexota bacterium]|nr:hypothetical protein [Chloroflexota bacterium]
MASSGETSAAAAEFTIAVSRQELTLIRSALEEFMASFSHEQGELVDRIKLLLAHLPDDGSQANKRQGAPPFQRLTL